MNVPQELVRNPEFTNIDVAVWCYVYMETYAPYKEHTLLSAMQIVHQMYGTCDVPHNLVNKITVALQRLLESGMLIGERAGRQYYSIAKETYDYQQWKDEHKKFVAIDIAEIRQIFREHKRPFSVLRYFLLILSTCDPKTDIGIMKNESIAEILDADQETITRYFGILEKLQLLYIFRAQYSSNTYGRYKDREKIIAAGNKRTGGKQLKLSANRKRQMTQWYNQIKKGNPKYTQDQEIMRTVREYCEKDKSRYDMSVFT